MNMLHRFNTILPRYAGCQVELIILKTLGWSNGFVFVLFGFAQDLIAEVFLVDEIFT